MICRSPARPFRALPAAPGGNRSHSPGRPASRAAGRAPASRAGARALPAASAPSARPAPRAETSSSSVPACDVKRDVIAVSHKRERAADRRLGGTCKTQVPNAVPLMRPSVTRTMSSTPAAASRAGIGTWPHSGMPGTPTGPAPPSTSTLSPVTSSVGVVDALAHLVVGREHDRRAAMAKQSRRCGRGLEQASVGRERAAHHGKCTVIGERLAGPVGSAAPVTVTPSLSSPSCRPDPVTASSSNTSWRARRPAPGTPPAVRNSCIKSLPDGSTSATTGTDRLRRPMSFGSQVTPARPAIASRCSTTLVEPPTAFSPRMAFRNAASSAHRMAAPGRAPSRRCACRSRAR